MGERVKRRETLEILVDLLTLALNGANKTRLVYGANLNFGRFEQYASLLLGKGLLAVVDDPRGSSRKRYVTTKKGKDLLRHQREINKLLL